VRRPFFVIPLAVGAVLLIAFGIILGSQDGKTPDRPPRPPVARGGIEPRQFSAMNDFGLEYLRAAGAQNPARSFGCSPYAAYSALAVFANGSEAKTREQTLAAMRLKQISTGDLSDGVTAILDDLTRTKEAPFKSRNGIFMIWPIMMSADFQGQMKDFFDADVIRLGSAGMGSTNRVNEWAAQSTQNRVPTMVGTLTKDDVFFTINPVLIGGAWEEGFDPSLTQQRDFRSDEGPVPAMMMQREGAILSKVTNRWTAVTLPFRDSNVHATFVLPKDGSVEGLLGTLNTKELKDLLSLEGRQKITLSLPKFSLDTDIDIKPFAANLGLDYLFHAPIDLRYLSEEMKGDYEMASWHQRVVADFTEQGDQPKPTSGASENIDFNRPFLWFVSDAQTGVMLAGGVYRGQDPRNPNPHETSE
jgi:serine protease inhibitor